MRNIAPIDPLEEIELPPPLRSIRPCGIVTCRNPARSGGWRCQAHHRLDVRRWRSKNRFAINTRRRGIANERDAAKRATDSARAKLAMALKRGKIQRGVCVECCSPKVAAYIADPARWRDIVWVCHEHRHAVIEGLLKHEQARKKQAIRNAKREWALAVLASFPPDVQAEIQALALRPPPIFRNTIFHDRELEIGSPFYLSQLVAEVEKRVASTASPISDITTSAESDCHRTAAANEKCAAPPVP